MHGRLLLSDILFIDKCVAKAGVGDAAREGNNKVVYCVVVQGSFYSL